MNKVRDVKQLTPTWPITPAAKDEKQKPPRKKTPPKRRRDEPADTTRDPSKHIDEYV